MRYLLLALALMFSSPASAATMDDLCRELEDTAVTILKARYSGMSMSTAMRHVEDNAATGPESLRKLLRAMIIEAYSLPNFTTERYKREQREEFATKVALACYKQLL